MTNMSFGVAAAAGLAAVNDKVKAEAIAAAVSALRDTSFIAAP
ncbi:hypothetical protein [Paraburkholderia sp. 35.1]